MPKGTLSYWCREIRLTEAQIEGIKARTSGPRGVPRDNQRKRREKVAQIKEEAYEFALAHLDDPLWVAGTVMY